MSTHNDAMADALIEEVKQLRDLVFTICSERDQLQADLAAARAMLRDCRLAAMAIREHDCKPGSYADTLLDRIDAALAGEKK